MYEAVFENGIFPEKGESGMKQLPLAASIARFLSRWRPGDPDGSPVVGFRSAFLLPAKHPEWLEGFPKHSGRLFSEGRWFSQAPG